MVFVSSLALHGKITKNIRNFFYSSQKSYQMTKNNYNGQ